MVKFNASAQISAGRQLRSRTISTYGWTNARNLPRGLAVAGDRLTCRAEVVKPGRLLTVVDAKVTCRIDGAEKLVAVALATIANLEIDQTSAARMAIG
ncbi:MAG: hypothetical protein QOH67_309 [Hyphomicrobiales bacterium]|nr:hypothetical protein [Hyphomicrobiales bacterium]